MRRRSDIAYGRLLLGSDLKALFSKVLCCAGVIGNVGDGRSESEIEVCALAVLLCDSIGVVKDGGHESVDGILGDGVAGEKNSADCDGGCILRQTVGVGRDGVLGVVGVLAMTFGTGFRSDRVRVWRDPFSDLEGTGYQIVQSLYAIASGGMFGLGIGGSRQKLGYMPEAHNDIIFAIICEELGWFGAAIVVILFAIFVWRGIVIAINHKDDMFAMLMATGITVMIAVQVIINIAVVTNSMPNTGIPLPFISYGGTSMVIMMACMGILMNISRYDEISESEIERKK